MSIFSSIGKLFKKGVKTVNKVLGSPLGGLTGDVVGGVISNKGAAQSDAAAERINSFNVASQERINAQNLQLQREQMAREEALQREFAQMGTRWKVEDAKKAGLHPLYALGGSGATYSPSVVLNAGQAPQKSAVPSARGANLQAMGQNLGSAIRATQTATQRALDQAQLGQIAASTDMAHAQAEYYRSEARRLRQTPATAFPLGTRKGDQLGDYHDTEKALTATWQNITNQVPSHDRQRGVKAGEYPGLVEHNIGGRKILLMESDEGPANSLAETPWYMLKGLYDANVKRYGRSYANRTFSTLFNPMHGTAESVNRWLIKRGM